MRNTQGSLPLLSLWLPPAHGRPIAGPAVVASVDARGLVHGHRPHVAVVHNERGGRGGRDRHVAFVHGGGCGDGGGGGILHLRDLHHRHHTRRGQLRHVEGVVVDGIVYGCHRVNHHATEKNYWVGFV